MPVISQLKICTDKPIIEDEERIFEELRALSRQIRANGEHAGHDAFLEMALLRDFRWQAGSELRVRFRSGDEMLQRRVAAVAHVWSQYANIRFNFDNHSKPDILIDFDQNDGGSWSLLGTQSRQYARQGQTTMNFGWLTPTTDDEEVRRVVLHEFGHALGCIHEHQNPAGGIHWNKEAAYEYYLRTNNWDRNDVDAQVFRKYERNRTQFTAVDPTSIMMYAIPKELTTDGFSAPWNTVLSPADKTFIAKAYPAQRPVAFSLDARAGQLPVAANDRGVVGAESPPPAPEDYAEREGYRADFLDPDPKFHVPLPIPTGDLVADLAPVEGPGTTPEKGLLHYTHFSIALSRTRRLAIFTACNVDGNKEVRIPRTRDRWILDPRAAASHQCGPELYSRNRFDRGHLVRREDPNWGPEAQIANQDTFHYTNAAPQHEMLNQREWLELEDYILKNANNKNIKISVFTGPVFTQDDFVYRGVQIPESFWKVVVLVNGNQLSATAYLLSQSRFMSNLEFTYGAFKTYQVPISLIEERTGLDFGSLRNVDPLSGREALEEISTYRPLVNVGEIRL